MNVDEIKKIDKRLSIESKVDDISTFVNEVFFEDEDYKFLHCLIANLINRESFRSDDGSYYESLSDNLVSKKWPKFNKQIDSLSSKVFFSKCEFDRNLKEATRKCGRLADMVYWVSTLCVANVICIGYMVFHI